MSIISNEHQSGSPFDSEPEPSEPGCICGRGVRCPLHGGPPQPGPEPMTTERQPGSPGVDLDELEREGIEWDDGQLWRAGLLMAAELRTLRARVAELEMPDTEADRILTMSDEELDSEIRAVGIDPVELDKRASHVAKWAAECSKLRARVVERGALIRKLDAEFSSARVGVMGMFGQLHEHLELMISYLEHEGAQGDGISEEHWDGYQAAKALLAKTAPDAPQWENAQIETADLLRRAESAEARIAALEKLFDDAGHGEHNVLALIDHYQSEAMAESEARRAALARVGELECAEADLESQLAAAREEQGLERLVRATLKERNDSLAFYFSTPWWCARWLSRDESERGRALERVQAETLPALLRAILECEAQGG